MQCIFCCLHSTTTQTKFYEFTQQRIFINYSFKNESSLIMPLWHCSRFLSIFTFLIHNVLIQIENHYFGLICNKCYIYQSFLAKWWIEIENFTLNQIKALTKNPGKATFASKKSLSIACLLHTIRVLMCVFAIS